MNSRTLSKNPLKPGKSHHHHHHHILSCGMHGCLATPADHCHYHSNNDNKEEVEEQEKEPLVQRPEDSTAACDLAPDTGSELKVFNTFKCLKSTKPRDFTKLDT